MLLPLGLAAHACLAGGSYTVNSGATLVFGSSLILAQEALTINTGATLQINISSTSVYGRATLNTVTLQGTLSISGSSAYLNSLPDGSQFHLLHVAAGVAGYADPNQRMLVYPALPLDWYVIYLPSDVYLVKTRIQHRVTLK